MRITALILTLVLASPALASPIFDGTAANVWVVNANGTTQATFNLSSGQPSVSALFGIGSALIEFADSSTQLVPGIDSSDVVLVNHVDTSYPLPGIARNVRIKGLVLATSNPNQPQVPGISIDPSSGTFTKTTKVTLTAQPGQGNPSPVIVHWKLGAGPTQSKTANEAHVYLMDPGSHTIEAWVQQGAHQSIHAFATLTLDTAGLDARRDTDGDGIPDQVEIELGFDPTDPDAARDGDDDGWSDLDELLRSCVIPGSNPPQTIPASDPGVFASTPPDSDGDGWSDCDEIWRGTRIDDAAYLLDPLWYFPDAPSAERLYEVEHLLSGQIWDDAAHSVPRTDLGSLTGLDLFWNVHWDQAALPDYSSPNHPPYSGMALPQRFRLPYIEGELAAGNVPAIRLPAGLPTLLRAREVPVQPRDPGGPWVAKAWLPEHADLEAGDVSAYLASLGTPWNDAAEWLAGYRAYLAAELVQETSVDLAPDSALAIHLLEAAAAGYDDVSGDGLVLLGNKNSFKPTAALEKIENAMEAVIDTTQVPSGEPTEIAPERTFSDLLADYEALLQPGQPLAPFATTVDGFFQDPEGGPESTTERSSAALAQGSGSDVLPVPAYLALLLVQKSLALIDALDPVARAELLDPAGDSDGDGVPNDVEVLAGLGSATDPELADSDADGIPDDQDPCAHDGTNTCLYHQYLTMDSDGDGIIDSLDVCMNTPDPLQTDTDDVAGSGQPDGIGDACLRYANIRTPVSNLRVFAGTPVEFTSLVTELSHTGALAYLWDFDGGAPNSTLPNPGAVAFPVPGDYDVSLTVSDQAPSATPPDLRTIIVIGAGPAPSVDAGPDRIVVEGVPVQLEAVASSQNGPITGYAWSFGDGGSDTSNPTSHVWAQQGNYVATVKATDAFNLFAMDSLNVGVVDSVPDVEIGYDASDGPVPLTVQFTDLSIAYDGIVARTWDFGDGSPTSNAANPQHTFSQAGSFFVSLQVEDGDGSIVSEGVWISAGQVPGIPVFPYSWLSALLAACLMGAALALRPRVGPLRTH